MQSSIASAIAIVGAGHVGGRLARALRGADASRPLRLSTRSSESRDRWRREGFDARVLDLLDSRGPSIRSALGECAAVVVCVAAGRGAASERVYGEAIPALARAVDSNVHLVYTSSTGVYAENTGGWVDEDAALDRSSPRAEALVAAEAAVVAHGHGTVLRLSGLMDADRGPHRRLETLAGTRREDGWLNLVEVDDVVRALVQVLGTGTHGVFNLSAPPLPRRDFYDPLLAAAKREPIEWFGAPSNVGRRVRAERFRRAMGWAPGPIDPLRFAGDAV